MFKKYFRNAAQQLQEKSEKMQEKEPYRHQGQRRRKGTVKRTTIQRLLPPHPIEGCVGVDLHTAAPGKPHITAMDVALRKLQPVESLCREQAPGRSCSMWRRVHSGAGGLAGTAAHGGGRIQTGAVCS